MNPTAALEPALASPAAVPADDAFYEVVNGNRVELPPMSVYAVLIATELSRLMGNHGAANNLGRAVTEGLFRLPLARDRNRNRQPDVAFVSFTRWPRERPLPRTEKAWDVVPDLAAEVVSPTDRVEELFDKIADYFEAGVSLVWVLLPNLRMVHVYESLTRVRGLAPSDELDGGVVLPGFRTPVAALFPAMEPPSLA
jgi:Uma2 family endonuclease